MAAAAAPVVTVVAVAVTDPHASLTPAQIRAALTAVMTTILLAALDQTIVGVAVPTIARELGGFEWMAWVISGYLIACVVVTPLYGKLGDLIGRRSVLTLAIGIFVVASVGCALAQSMPQLVIARVLQGVGGGGLIATSQAVIADVVPLRERGRYQGYISIVWAVASLLGPVVGGVLTHYLSWQWIFWINLPLGLAAWLLVRSALPKSGVRARDARIDVAAALLLLGGLTALLVPITRMGQGTAWHDPLNLGGWALALLLLAGFGWQQRRSPDAIVPMALLRNPTVVACSAMLFICFFNFIALSVLVPLRLQLSAGYSAADAALHLLPLSLAIPAGAFAAGRWLHARGTVRPMQRLGAVLAPVALAALGFSEATGPVAVGALVVLGVASGLQLPTALITVQQSVPRHQVGTVTGLTAFARQLGGAVGVAVLSAVALLLLRDHLPAGVTALDAEGLGRMLDAARAASADGAGTSRAADAAFRSVMRISAVVSLASLWFVTRLPDLQLGGPAGPQHDAAPVAREP